VIGALAGTAYAETLSPPKKVNTGYSWNELVAVIERTNPLMLAARSGVKSFEAKLKQAKWAYFPSFKLEASLGPTPTITGDALKSEIDYGTWGYYVRGSLTMVQPLYTFGKIAALKKAASGGVAIGKDLVRVARWELRHRLAQAYYGVQLHIELDAILREGKKWLRKADSRMTRLRTADSDEYNQNEHLRLKTRVAEFYLLEAENNRLKVNAQHGLRLLTQAGLKPSRLRLKQMRLKVMQFPIRKVEVYLATAAKYEPMLSLSKHKLIAQGALYAHKKASLLPDLVLVGSVVGSHSDVIASQSSFFAPSGYHGFGAAALVGFQWNLDVPRKLYQANEAKALFHQARYALTSRRDLTELKVRDLHQRLSDRRRLVSAYERSYKAARGWLMASWDLYDDGFGEFRTVMEALVQFYSKQVAFLKMVFEHNVLAIKLSQAVGADITIMSGSQKAPSAPKNLKGK
jgi:multidrug efflux system outer membrane protein